MNSAVLFLIFNRPDLTGRVFERIRKAKPPNLYIAADGPRPDQEGEREICARTREIATSVDWPCRVSTLFSDRNLGCGQAVRKAIDWFFEQEEEGIILEDDCLPARDFFPYCEQLLAEFRSDARVAMISGFNGVSRLEENSSAIHYTKIPHIWGWASWRRAWQGPKPTKSDWETFRESREFRDTVGWPKAEGFWRRDLNRFFEDGIDTWDLPWVVQIWLQGQVSVSPGVNLVENIGFDARATHTRSPDPAIAELGTGALQFPLRIGPVRVDRQWERSVYRNIFRIGNEKRWWRKPIRRIMGRIRRKVLG